MHTEEEKCRLARTQDMVKKKKKIRDHFRKQDGPQRNTYQAYSRTLDETGEILAHNTQKAKTERFLNRRCCKAIRKISAHFAFHKQELVIERTIQDRTWSFDHETGLRN